MKTNIRRGSFRLWAVSTVAWLVAATYLYAGELSYAVRCVFQRDAIVAQNRQWNEERIQELRLQEKQLAAADEKRKQQIEKEKSSEYGRKLMEAGLPLPAFEPTSQLFEVRAKIDERTNRSAEANAPDLINLLMAIAIPFVILLLAVMLKPVVGWVLAGFRQP